MSADFGSGWQAIDKAEFGSIPSSLSRRLGGPRRRRTEWSRLWILLVGAMTAPVYVFFLIAALIAIVVIRDLPLD